MAWFLRGAQSAFFYYVSCAPCANARFNHRRAKEKARVDKATKKALLQHASRHGHGDSSYPEKMHADDQDLLAGVGAFTTNIYWQDEIDLGPSFKKGMRPRQNDASGDRKESKKGKGRGRQTSAKKSTQEIKRVGNGGGVSLDSVRTEDGLEDNLNSQSLFTSTGNQERSRYQRPNDALWGHAFPEKDWNFYSRGRNPSINSLTPPEVCTLPATAEEGAWMLQPPPPAKVMEGKQSPLQRADSFGAASKRSVVSKISKKSGGTRFSELRRPEKVILADLGDDICSMSIPAKPERKSLRKLLPLDGTKDLGRPVTPDAAHVRTDSAFSTFDTPSRQISRANRPQPIKTDFDSESESNRDTHGFDPYWTFPKRELPQSSASQPEPMSTVSDSMFYHSEPEPDRAHAYGIAFQDFARPMSTLRTPGTADSDAPFQTPKSKATTREESNSPSPRTLSPDSSSSSVNVLKDVLAPTAIVEGQQKSGDDTSAVLDHKARIHGMEGITEEDVENLLPRYSSGPREVRLGSGTRI